MRVEIQLERTSQKIVYDNVLNAYTKGPMYCVLIRETDRRVVHKFPVDHIFRVVEDYSESK